MEILVTNLGTLGPLLTSVADFYHNTEPDEDGYILNNGTPFLEDIPVMPVTGRNTRQDGIIQIAMAGSLPYETKWSAFDLTDETRGLIKEQDTVVVKKYNRNGSLLNQGTYLVAGVTEYDDPENGFAYAVLSLKDVVGE